MNYSDLKYISKKPLEHYSRVFSLNDYQLRKDKDVYHKYIPISYLEDYQNNHRIAFVSPSSWTDPFETRYFQIPYTRINYTEPMIFCMCLTDKHSQNEDAMWLRYAKHGVEMVRIDIVIKQLLDILEKQGKKEHFKTFIGEVVYSSKTDIRNTTKRNKVFFPNGFDIENYLSLMSLKRIAFSYENEVRIFIVPDEKLPPNNLYYVDIKDIATIVNKITVSPYPIVYTPFPNPDSMSYLNVRKDLAGLVFKRINTEASRLFEECPKCVL